MYHLSEAYLMAAFIVTLAAYFGALIFGAAAVAPTAVRILDEQSCAVFLRSYWLTYHRLAAGGGFLLALILAVGSIFSAVPLIYVTFMLALISAMALCFWIGLQLIPSINAARDAGDMAGFNSLHRLDVALIGAGLLLAFSLLVGLIYVLPGQFTFWPTALHNA